MGTLGWAMVLLLSPRLSDGMVCIRLNMLLRTGEIVQQLKALAVLPNDLAPHGSSNMSHSSFKEPNTIF